MYVMECGVRWAACVSMGWGGQPVSQWAGAGNDCISVTDIYIYIYTCTQCVAVG